MNNTQKEEIKRELTNWYNNLKTLGVFEFPEIFFLNMKITKITIDTVKKFIAEIKVINRRDNYAMRNFNDTTKLITLVVGKTYDDCDETFNILKNIIMEDKYLCIISASQSNRSLELIKLKHIYKTCFSISEHLALNNKIICKGYYFYIYYDGALENYISSNGWVFDSETKQTLIPISINIHEAKYKYFENMLLRNKDYFKNNLKLEDKSYIRYLDFKLKNPFLKNKLKKYLTSELESIPEEKRLEVLLEEMCN